MGWPKQFFFSKFSVSWEIKKKKFGLNQNFISFLSFFTNLTQIHKNFPSTQICIVQENKVLDKKFQLAISWVGGDHFATLFCFWCCSPSKSDSGSCHCAPVGTICDHCTLVSNTIASNVFMHHWMLSDMCRKHDIIWYHCA